MLLEKLPQTLQQKHVHNPPWVRTYSQHEHFFVLTTEGTNYYQQVALAQASFFLWMEI